jgi:hypothetical protein
MVRIGRIATIQVNFEIFVDKFVAWLPSRPAITEPEPEIFKQPESTPTVSVIHIYGETEDLVAIQDQLVARGIPFTTGGAAPTEPTDPPPDPPPTQDEIDSLAFFKQAFNEEFAAMEAAILSNIETRYNVLNTTPIPFADVPKSDIKHLRQRLN